MHPVLGSQVYFPLDADSLRESLEVEDSGPESGAETESESPHLELLDLDDIEAVGGPLELERVLDSQIAVLEMVKEMMEEEERKSHSLPAERLENGVIGKNILSEEMGLH